MKEIVIHSFDELQKVMFDGVWEEDIQRYRSNFVYRGVDNASYGLNSKLNRVCDFKLDLEDSIIRNFKKYGYADLVGYNSFWQTLALAQHYGLPTRLLDWTYSPLVAAHFCTENIDEYEHDAVIWCVDVGKVQEILPNELKVMLKESQSNTFTFDMLDKVAKDFKEFKELKDEPFFIFYEPSSLTDRIANQYALFSVVSDTSVSLTDLLPDDENICYKIIIPKEIKLEIRDKLDYINISERLIYPGLDGICKWITRRYMNLGPKYNKK